VPKISTRASLPGRFSTQFAAEFTGHPPAISNKATVNQQVINVARLLLFIVGYPLLY
jgi:hypothetical protein